METKKTVRWFDLIAFSPSFSLFIDSYIAIFIYLFGAASFDFNWFRMLLSAKTVKSSKIGISLPATSILGDPPGAVSR